MDASISSSAPAAWYGFDETIPLRFVFGDVANDIVTGSRMKTFNSLYASNAFLLLPTISVLKENCLWPFACLAILTGDKPSGMP